MSKKYPCEQIYTNRFGVTTLMYCVDAKFWLSPTNVKQVIAIATDRRKLNDLKYFDAMMDRRKNAIKVLEEHMKKEEAKPIQK